ncbi:ABC transporter substrate-binding protein [Chlamydia ibidis]|uniref:ABC transporter substrate-binding protein n=1 Tax=Chlamydia ibidis TaxID=1405396 RepID=UPI0038B2ADAB
MRKSWLAFVSLLLPLSSCQSDTLKQSQSLIIAIHDDPSSLSPAEAKRALDLSVAKMTFDSLTRENTLRPDCIEMALASHYTVSEDLLEYTFFIRENARWSNGAQITAKDVIESWSHARSYSPHSELFSGIDFYESSPLSVTITLKNPNPKLLHLLAFPAFSIFNPHNLNLYTGPFRVISYTPGHCMLLKKNPYYYDKEKLNISNISLLVIPDIHTAFLLLNKKKIHWLGQPWHQGLPKELKNAPHLHYVEYPIEGTFWLVLNTKHPKLKELQNRYRFAAAINKQALVDYALQGNQLPAFGISRNSSVQINYQIQTKITPPEKLTLTYPANILRCQRIAEILKEQCKSVGIDLFLEGVEYHVFNNRRNIHDFTIATATGISCYHGAPILPHEEKLLKNLEIIPLYHMSYDYLSSKIMDNVIYNASGSVDLKYTSLSN